MQSLNRTAKFVGYGRDSVVGKKRISLYLFRSMQIQTILQLRITCN